MEKYIDYLLKFRDDRAAELNCLGRGGVSSKRRNTFLEDGVAEALKNLKAGKSAELCRITVKFLKK